MVENWKSSAAALPQGKEALTCRRETVTAASAQGARPGPLDAPGGLNYNERLSRGAPIAREAVTSISGYQVLAKLREGAQSELYLVRDTAGRRFALKVLPQRLAGVKSASKRLMNEGATGMRLRHSENVIRTEKVGRDEGRNFVVLEYLRGQTLRGLIRAQGPVSERDLVAIARQSALGLSYIHEQGIVHKDVKPDNIFVTDEGVVKIIDFGIAESKVSSRFTFFRKIEGSPSYIAPELLEKARPDELSDIYAFGITLYEAATGRLPYSAGGAQQIMNWTKDRRRKAEPPRTYAEDLSSYMDSLITKCIEKDRSARVSSFTAFYASLGRNPLMRGSATGISTAELKKRLAAKRARGGSAGQGGSQDAAE